MLLLPSIYKIVPSSQPNIYILFIFSLLSPSTKPGPRYLHSCNYTEKGCSMTEGSSFQGIQQSRFLPPSGGWKHPISENFYSLPFSKYDKFWKEKEKSCCQ
jgi:hypothetical protein